MSRPDLQVANAAMGQQATSLAARSDIAWTSSDRGFRQLPASRVNDASTCCGRRYAFFWANGASGLIAPGDSSALETWREHVVDSRRTGRSHGAERLCGLRP